MVTDSAILDSDLREALGEAQRQNNLGSALRVLADYRRENAWRLLPGAENVVQLRRGDA